MQITSFHGFGLSISFGRDETKYLFRFTYIFIFVIKEIPNPEGGEIFVIFFLLFGGRGTKKVENQWSKDMKKIFLL